MTSMTAVVKAAAGPGAEIDQIAIPEPTGKDVLIEVAASSICGTDVHIFDWNDWARRHIRPPRVFGHEMSGRVVAVGSDVREVEPGTYVAAETHVVDHTCRQCQRGLYHLCENVRVLGVDRDGSFARYVLLPAENCWRNAPGLSPEVAALQEPFGNAVHAALAGPLKDNAVAIFGLGPIGLCAVGIARAEGAAAVYGVEPNPYRRALAERMGATAVFPPGDTTVQDIRRVNGGVGVDIVLEMSGHPTAVEQGLQVLHNGGWISLLGIGDRPVTLDLNDLVVTKSITIYGIFGRRIWDTWERTSSYLSTGRVDVSPLITHRFPLDDFQEAMAQMKSGRAGKVVLLPSGG
ncbi:MAG: L-threonine 3-dehydrogenase [Chloroflexi bacterium 13_1_20CM_66_33]|nr:MAG: L-threonine 3-dehydrogenase [Chloroflexi bacterium 13_1_20CM_66_33]OLD91634.1 MAG: L-threonine 3-dehydrogenase [Chloroflexi bacterium 13_1_20CM_4_66_15]